MSKIYPIWWDTTITIYNQYKDPITKVIRWYYTQVTDCFWKNIGTKVQINNTIIDTHSIVVRIPQNPNYLDSDAWKNLTNDTMPNYFTLQTNDIIVLGDCDEEINEGVSGERSTDFLNRHKGKVMVIKEFAIDTFTGLDNPHYRVLGE